MQLRPPSPIDPPRSSAAATGGWPAPDAPGSLATPTTPDEGWVVEDVGFDPACLAGRETVLTVGNGLLCTRGSLEEGHPAGRPATLVHGLFDAHPSAVTELVNAPDWTALQVVVVGERFSLERGELLFQQRRLDLRTGLLTRLVRWRSPGGRTVELRFERFASLAEPHLLSQRLIVTPLDFDGRIEVRAALDGRTDTDGLLHWRVLDQGAETDRAWLELRTRTSGIRLGLAMRLAGLGGRGTEVEAWDAAGDPHLVRAWHGEVGRPAGVEKTVTVATSRECTEPAVTARARLVAADGGGWEDRLAATAAAWRDEWSRADIEIDGDAAAQLAVRFSIYQLLIAGPRHDEQVSIGARALSGFGYRGHAFWDTETFMLPFFSHVRPAIARNLLSYRWHRLDAARHQAEALGLRGARFPWESAASGEETTPRWLPDPHDPSRLARIWTGDIELHVSSDIAYAVLQYWRATADDAFLLERGAEVVLETARFWADRAEWDESDGHFHVRDVIGPDEYHEHVNDNAFTNAMLRWHLLAASRLAAWLRSEHPSEAERLLGDAVTADAEATRWRHVAELVAWPADQANGLVEQFAGYFSRRDVDLSAFADRSRSIQAVLGIEATNETQLLKQPDVLMLACLVPELFDETSLAANDAYYTPRTDHTYGSSLGPAIQAVVACRLDRVDEAYEHLMRAGGADLFDVRGNAADGIHAASAGGIWQAVVFGFGGLRFDAPGTRMPGETPGTASPAWRLEPRLPRHWSRLAFRFHHAGRLETVELRQPGAVPMSDETPREGAVAARDEPVRGFIFDLDGVLTDTAEAHYLAWQRLADDEGIAFDRGANEGLRGVSRRASLDRVLAGRPVTEAEAESLMARKNEHYLDLVGRMGPADVLPGVERFLSDARAAGLRIALASASRNASEVVERLGLRQAIDVLCDGSSVERGKPAPDLFLHAAERLGLAPASCVVFEDAAAGIEAAHAAAMRAVGVGPAERVGDAELVLAEGLAGVSVGDVLAALEGEAEAAA